MRKLFVIAVLSLASSVAWSQAAKDVKCKQCVNTGDIEASAVKTTRIADGAVTMDKLAQDVIDSIGGSGGGSTGTFVGFSDTTVSGSNFGLKAYGDACSAAFGPGARIATTEEVALATTFPTASSNRAWVRPIDSTVLGSTDFCGVDGVSSGASVRTTNFRFETSDCVDQLLVACAM